MTSRHLPQRGVTLVELMIALAIGLLIVLVVTSAYLSGIGTQRAQTDMTRLEESARFSFDLLSRAIRRAGFRNTNSVPSTARPFCATDVSTAGSEFRATNDPVTVDLGGGVSANVLNKSDTITVRYYGEDDPTAPGTPDGVVLDCLGNAVGRGGKPDGTPVQDTIYVAADPANGNEPTLFCNTDNPAANPKNLALIPGVESMQILFAESGDTINRYIHANNDPAVVDKNPALDDVRGMLVSLIVRTPSTTGSDRSAKTFNHFGDNYAAAAAGDTGATFTGAADGRVRLHFANFVALRNVPNCPVVP